jgi:hypothetical protein
MDKFNMGLKLAFKDIPNNMLFSLFVIGGYIISISVMSMFSTAWMLTLTGIINLIVQLLVAVIMVFTISTILYAIFEDIEPEE